MQLKVDATQAAEEALTTQVQEGAIGTGARVLIVDDLLATGGTMAAASSLVRRSLFVLIMMMVMILATDFCPGSHPCLCPCVFVSCVFVSVFLSVHICVFICTCICFRSLLNGFEHSKLYVDWVGLGWDIC